MNRTEGTMEYLQKVVKEGREFFDRHGKLNLGYIDATVTPALEDVLQSLCSKIEERHKIKPEDDQYRYTDVIHYTSINTLVSMLQQAAKNKQSASLRLYDSAHFNDPDEGNYFLSNLNLPKKYGWLGDNKESHAYIASFIIPNDARDEREMRDNLVFWRTYGRGGEGCSLKLSIPRDRLRKVLYGADKVKCTGKTLRPVLEAIHPLVSIRKRSLKEKVREKLAEAVWKSLARLQYLYKSEAYRYEQECRFVIPELEIVNKDKINFEYKKQNNSPPYLRHYYEDDALALEKILISGSAVTLGPCVPYRSDVSNCLETLKRRAEIYGTEINISKISYRKP